MGFSTASLSGRSESRRHLDPSRGSHARAWCIEPFVVCFLLGLLLLPAGAWSQGRSHESQKDKKWNIRREVRLDDYRDEKGKVRPDLWEQGMGHARKMKFAAGVQRNGSAPSPDSLEAAAAVVPPTGNPLSGVQWVQIGPQPAFPIEGINFQGNGAMSGEVLDIAIDPRGTSDTVIYSVTNDGGVWRSTDGGVTFEPKTDNMPSLSMGAIVLDPGNPSIVYAGTGNLYDGNFTQTLLAVKAVGVYRSTDMGESWTVLNPGGIFSGNGISRMAMPAPGVLLVGSSNGLYKSVNSGMTFGTPPLYNDGNPIVAGLIDDVDLGVDNGGNPVVYLSVDGVGILLSNDAGDTFPTNLFGNNDGSPNDPTDANGAFTFLRMAQAASNPGWLYATVQEIGPPAPDPDGDADSFLGLYNSMDFGATWARLPAADVPGAANNGCQCGYDQTVGVDPRDHLTVYIGFQELYRSTDGGNSFGNPAISRDKIHWDHHFIGFSPPSHWGGLAGGDPTPMWVGTDGGIHSSSDAGNNFNNFHNATIASNLFHHIDIGRGSAANNAWTYGGTQDTGTLHSCAPAGACGGAALASGAIPWEMGNNGDGNDTAVDPSNPMRAYGVRNGSYYFTDDGGSNWQQPNPAALPVPPLLWRYRIEFEDPTRVWALTSNPMSFAFPGAQLWRSNDGTGLNWTMVNTFPGNVYAIANTPSDPNVLWFGRTNGTVHNTLDGTAANPTFSAAMNVTGSPGTNVSGIAINPLNSSDVVVVYRGQCGAPCNNPDNLQRRVFRTLDNGTTWNDISGTNGNPEGNLPNLPVHSVVFDVGTIPPTIIVSNDAGVMRSANNGATWERLGLGLPTADSKMLRIDHFADPPLLRLGTYGRSVWELSEAQGPILAVNTDLGFDTVCIGERQTRVVQLFNVGSEPLTVTSFFRLSGSSDFSVISGPTSGVVIPPGGEVDYTVEFIASTAGDQNAIFQVNSDDQFSPQFQISASGTVNTQMIATVIADSGSFGEVCSANDFHDLDLTISNPGCGVLQVNDIMVSGSDPLDFDLAGVMSFPLTVAAGTSTAIPIRFDPSGLCGEMRSADLDITSDDPLSPTKSVSVSGTIPCPDINVAIADSGDFGNVCKGDFHDLDLTLFNQGRCDLTISSLNLLPDPDSILLPDDLELPLVLSHDADFTLPLRYAPQECFFGKAEERTLRITSDDPDDPMLEVGLKGKSPCPDLVIDPASLSDLYAFPTTVTDPTGTLGCFSERSAVLRNVGICPLTISSIDAEGVSGNAADFSVVAPTQLPILLPPGEETLAVDVRFTPQADTDPLAPSEVLGQLTVVSDDPDFPHQANLCGESSAQSGVRILVTDISSGVPVPIGGVDQLNITSKGKNDRTNLRFTDVGVSTASVCGNTVTWHVDQETLGSTGTTGSNPQSSYSAKAKEGNLQVTESFTLGQCEFDEFQLQLQDGGSSVCLLLQKGESCTQAGQCCSGKCKGPAGNMTCR